MQCTDQKSFFITHPIFRRSAFGLHHPLSIARQAAVFDLCTSLDWMGEAKIVECDLARRDALLLFHDAKYLDALECAAKTISASVADRKRYNIGTMECPLFEGLWERACASVGGSMKAAELAAAGHVVFHPGGGTHHGRPDRAAGFCYLNDPVFAILELLQRGLQRVLYIDIDAHHGDGVEAAFLLDPRVFLVSLHEEGRWPHSGHTVWAPEHCVINISVPRQVNDTEYAYLFDNVVWPRITIWKPEAVVIVCGGDALSGDPLSSMALSNGLMWKTVERLLSLVGPAIVLGGGGYNAWTVTRLWTGLWGRLSGQPTPQDLPSAALDVLKSLSCDLVDDEDIEPAWLDRLEDKPNAGSIRVEVAEIVDAFN